MAAIEITGSGFYFGGRCRVGMGMLGAGGYGKVKAALGCFDERRLLLEPCWAE